MKTLFELPESTAALVRDLSSGRLRRTPGARIIPGVALGELERGQQRRFQRLRAEAEERRNSWRGVNAANALHTHQAARLAGGGFSARKAQLMGRAHRSHADDPKPSPGLACEPMGVNLPGWAPEVAV